MTRHRLFYIALILILAIVLLFGVWFVLWWTTQQPKAQLQSGQAHAAKVRKSCWSERWIRQRS